MKVGDLVKYKVDPESGVFIISSVKDGWCQLLEEDIDTYTTLAALELVSES